MKKPLLLVSILALFFGSCSSNKNYSFLVGTYTDNASQGINLINFDSKTNSVVLEKVITGVENPSFVIANKSKTIVVTVEETASNDGGKVTSFSYDKSSKAFTKINSFFTKGNHPCTVAFSKNENFVLVGNYSGGNLSVFPIDKFGNLSENNQLIQYEGKSVNVDRQEKPHVHSVVFHPTENKIFVTDLGRDVIEIIPFDENSKTFLQDKNTKTIEVPKANGPRHLVFNKAGTKAFVTFELTNQIGVFEYKNYKLSLIQTINLTDDKTKSGSAAEVKLSKDKKFLYASVRGNDNFIAVLQLENETKVIQKIPTGKSPRNFILTNNDKTVLVASQLSNTVCVYDRDIKTGLLTPTSNEILVNKPVYFCDF
ncbi:lactonase family protein [Flavobacterium sp.]|uniref:lactonase family protein n=1 Tax=Flavobacterium sp. TaxID=239 RepID=UPI0037534043